MILTVHQPAYLPWLGYFDKIIRSDIFIFLDSVQFEKNSFTNRNKIKTDQGTAWLTVPVKTKGYRNLSLRDIAIDNSKNWREKHLKSIHQYYKKAPFYEKNYEKINKLYQKKYELLAELCWDHLLFWLSELGINKKIVRSSELPIQSKKSELIFDLCQDCNADRYISGALGKNYLEEDRFLRSGIEIEFQNYNHPVYQQLWGNFISHLSIIDFWLNTNDYALITGDKDH